MKKAILKFLKVFIPLVFASIILGYFYFIKIPSNKAEFIANRFEVAVRNNDKIAVKKIASMERKFWTNIVLPRFQLFQEEFDKFYDGIEIYRCYYQPKYLFKDKTGRIIALGRMKAKIDNKYRDNFEIMLEQDGDEWKLGYFYFPDYVDY